MAQGVGSFQRLLGVLDTFGGHFWSPGNYSGPQSYVQGGDTIDPKSFGFNSTIFTLIGSIDSTDTYEAVPLLHSAGMNPVWRVVWRSMVTQGSLVAGEEVPAGTNLSAIIVGLSAIGY